MLRIPTLLGLLGLVDAKLIAAIDQGTTSTRVIIFDEAAKTLAVHQKEHTQIYPQDGWCEHSPLEILERC